MEALLPPVCRTLAHIHMTTPAVAYKLLAGCGRCEARRRVCDMMEGVRP
jgi:hypothetical protein